MKLKIFISSVQKEFQQARKDLKAFLLGDAVLHRFISEVFLFEELPARDRRADEAYLEQVKRCDIYLGIFGYEYGHEDTEGVSPTEREYDHAGRLGKTRLIYVWGTDEKQRTEKMKILVRKAGNVVIRRRVENLSALTAEVYASLVTGELLTHLHLNDRQLKGLTRLRSEGRLTSGIYQEETGASRQTATRDLEDMVKKGILEQRGERRGAFYVRAKGMPQL